MARRDNLPTPDTIADQLLSGWVDAAPGPVKFWHPYILSRFWHPGLPRVIETLTWKRRGLWDDEPRTGHAVRAELSPGFRPLILLPPLAG